MKNVKAILNFQIHNKLRVNKISIKFKLNESSHV